MSEYESEETTTLPSLTPAPQSEDKIAHKTSKEYPLIMPNLTNFAIPLQSQQATTPHTVMTNTRANAVPSLPFPLLIVQQKPQVNNGDVTSPKMSNLATMQTLQQMTQAPSSAYTGEVSALLKDLVDIQKENLSVEKQRLEIEKERLEYHKNVGNQLLTLIPIFSSMLQKFLFMNETNSDSPSQKNGKRKKPASDDILRESKILRTVLEKNIQKYMLEDDNQEECDQDNSPAINDKDEVPKKTKN